MDYRREIDGLRAVAVIPVILFHAGFKGFEGGFVGVDVFFVISGYLITSILINELESGEFSLLRFYERRARRILPALLFVIICCIPMAWLWMSPPQLEDFTLSILSVSTFSSNVLFWQLSNYFAPAAEEMPLLHTWSLAVEEQYYLFFPLILMVVWRYGRQRVLLGIALIALSSLLLSEWGGRNQPEANFFLAPTRAWELLAGAMCAFVPQGSSNMRETMSNMLSALGLLLIVFAIVVYDRSTPFPSTYALAPVLGAVLIVLHARQGTWIAGLLSTRGMVGIGLISYSAYLWHYPLFAFARVRYDHVLSGVEMLTLSATSLVLAYVSWRVIEQPFRKGRAASVLATRKAVFGAIGSVTGLLITFGASTHLSHGFEFRYPTEYIDRAKLMLSVKLQRQQAVRAGTCYFNESGKHETISGFTDHWSCLDDDEPELASLGIGVYGDSHSADKAVALRENGIDTLQVSGAGCPLLPEATARPYCNRLIDLFHEHAKAHGISTVMLAGRLDDHELEPRYLREVMAYWQQRYASVILFSPMPEYYKFDTSYLIHGDMSATRTPQDDSKEEAFYAALAGLDLPENVTVLNTRSIFCDGQTKCTPTDADTPLLVDYGHLSLHGAKRFGRNLLPELMDRLPKARFAAQAQSPRTLKR